MSPKTAVTTMPRPSNDVFIARGSENPVVAAFKGQGLYKRLISAGRHDVTCPWVEEHTDQLDTGTAYFEPTQDYPKGGFRCQHSHGDKYHIGEVLERFGLSDSEARNRSLIRTAAGEMNRIHAAAEEILLANGNIYQSGGVLVTVSSDPVTGDAQIVPISESALTLALSASCDWEKFDGRKQDWVRCDPPQRHVSMLYKAQTYQHILPLKGLARQPYYQEGSGELVSTSGYNSTAQRLGVFDPAKFPKPAASEAAAREALGLLQDLIGEFHFAEEVDRIAALSAMFTAVTRPSLGLAPAYHVDAPSSGSGKSYLCETIAAFAGPGSSSRVSYPKTSEEATKSVLSLLMSAPAVIEFDDMDTDWIPHGPINRMLTARSITDRVLGVSRVATVSTSVLVLGSGNNVGPVRDLSRRVLTIKLNAKSQTPGTLSYKGNPVATLRAERERYVNAVLTIIEAWKAAGKPKAVVPSIASYSGSWSDYCRQPLLWLGLSDPATALLDQMRNDPDAEEFGHLLSAWHGKHGDKALTLRKLLDDGYGGELQEALHDLPVVERGSINKSKLGWYFKRNMNRIVGGFVLEKAANSERNAWRVKKVGEREPASPSLPPSAAPIAPEDQY